MNNEKKSLNLNKILFAGGTALSASFALMHPLDTIRVHIQSSSKNKFRFSNFKNLCKFSSRGFLPSVLMSFPQGAIRLGTYEYSKEHLSGYLPLIINSATCAVLADIASSVVKIPKELITQKIQTNQHDNTRQVLKEVFTNKNFLSLYKGTASTIIRDIPFMVSLFSSYDFIKYQKSQREHEGRKMTTAEFTLMGGLSGAWSGFLTTPCDVIKTRIMTSKNQNQNITNTMIELLQENGFKSLFRGAGYRTIWWFGVCSIFFPIYETVKNY